MTQVFTGSQCRMARTYLRMSEDKFSELAGISKATLRKIEKSEGLPSIRIETYAAIYEVLKSTGKIELIGMDTVRLLKPENAE